MFWAARWELCARACIMRSSSCRPNCSCICDSRHAQSPTKQIDQSDGGGIAAPEESGTSVGRLLDRIRARVATETARRLGGEEVLVGRHGCGVQRNREAAGYCGCGCSACADFCLVSLLPSVR